MHADHQVFLDAIATKSRLEVRYTNRKLAREVVRICAPLDYGPLRGGRDNSDYYHLWDLEGRRKPLNIPLAPGDVVSMKRLDEQFDPAAIITWTFKPGAWRVPREWAEFS